MNYLWKVNSRIVQSGVILVFILFVTACDEPGEEEALMPKPQVVDSSEEKDDLARPYYSPREYGSALGQAKGAAENLLTQIADRDQELQDIADGVSDENDE